MRAGLKSHPHNKQREEKRARYIAPLHSAWLRSMFSGVASLATTTEKDLRDGLKPAPTTGKGSDHTIKNRTGRSGIGLKRNLAGKLDDS
jgi:hypothetical protein